jgi:DNA helicase IV
MALVAAYFDERQRQALLLPADEPLLVSGGAGSGKTTVALHRIARVHRAAPKEVPRRRMQVVVPEPALAALAADVLRELGLPTVDVATFESWAARQARRVLLDRPEHVLTASPAAVVALKRHPALRAALPAYAEALGLALARRIDRRLAGRGQIIRRWPEVAGPHLAARLDALEAALVAESPENLRHEVVAAVRRERTRLYRVREDLLELFGDSQRMAEVVAASKGELAPGVAAAVVAHTRAQLRATSAERFADVDAERKETLDRLGLDEGTPDELAHSFDREDDAVALELLRLKVGEAATRRGRLRAPALLLVDEAQDLAAIELALLGAARHGAGSLTVLGDDAQELASGTAFPGWDAVLAELGAAHATRVALVRNHRSRAPIVRFAAGVLGPLARPEEAAAPGGAEVIVTPTSDAATTAWLVGRALAELLARRPGVHAAVLAARAETARQLHAALPPALHARLSLAGEAGRPARVAVSTVTQAKGLEFDVVVIPDASAAAYPDEPAARRRLYVACSRAIEQLWLLVPGAPSPILGDATAAFHLP